LLTNNDIPPQFREDKQILAIDFDGVIHDSFNGYGDGTCYGKPIANSIESIKKLSTEYTIIIFTAKAKSDRPLVNGRTGIEHVWAWLKKYEIDKFISEVTAEKSRAKYYIDDSAIKFLNWNDTLKIIEEGKI